MNYLVIGAGNAGRPVARLLNNQNHKVIITDPKQLSDFKQDVQSILKQMEKEGVILDLGNDNPSIDGIDKVYKAPSLPDSAPIAKKVAEANLEVITNEDFSKMVNDLIPVPTSTPLKIPSLYPITIPFFFGNQLATSTPPQR